MPEIITLERKVERAPNIVRVINWPEYLATEYSTGKKLNLPVRGYICNINIGEIYGGIENAITHFLLRTNKEYLGKENGKILFLIAFVKGKIWPEDLNFRHDRDIAYFPFVRSNGRLKVHPYMVKDSGIRSRSELGGGGLCSYPPHINQDMFTVCAAEIENWEEAQRKTERDYSEYIKYLLKFGANQEEIRKIIEAQKQRDQNPLEYFCSTLPEIEGIEYTDIHTINT